jgi:hypothetical protein
MFCSVRMQGVWKVYRRHSLTRPFSFSFHRCTSSIGSMGRFVPVVMCIEYGQMFCRCHRLRFCIAGSSVKLPACFHLKANNSRICCKDQVELQLKIPQSKQSLLCKHKILNFCLHFRSVFSM